MKNIFLIIGESGSGKTTVVEKIKKISNLKAVDSYTTRPMRYRDEKGHIFVTDKEFDNLINICAYTEINGYRYAATSEQVDKNDIYIIDIKGVNFFKENYTGYKKHRIIYLSCDKEERIRRMRNRGDFEDIIQRRLLHDSVSFLDAKEIAHKIIKSNNIDETAREIVRYIEEFESSRGK